MEHITLKQAQEAVSQLNRDVYAALAECLKTFEEKTGLQPSHIEVRMSPFRNSYELDTVDCVVPHLADVDRLIVRRCD